MSRYTGRRVFVVAGVVLGLFVVSLPAGATPLGVNGQIAWDGPNGAGTVYTANQDGHHVFRVASASSCCPAWSPNGKRLLVSGPSSDGRITTSTVNADGTGFHSLRLATPGLNLACMVWSPNGKYCAAQGWDDKKPSLNGVYRVDVNNGHAVRLTSNPLRGHDIPGDYSPDGSQIVFGRYAASEAGVALYIVNANGGRPRRLIAENFQPVNDGSWSPQGNQIVFSRHLTADAPGSIWVIKSDGRGLREIKVAGINCGAVGCHGVQWSPDGKKIIFAANLGQSTSVYTANANGTDLKRVATGDDPVWGTHTQR